MIDYVGPVFWVLVALAFIGLLVVVERLLFFQHTRVNVGDLLLGVAHHVRRRAFAEALHEVDRASNPVSRVVHAIILRHYLERTNLREVAQEAGMLELPRIERNMRMLLAVALLAPLMGMFGTILGLIEVFLQLNEAGEVLATPMLAGGMFRSLVSTAMGLAIAIPAYLFYLYLLAKGNRLLRRIERAGIETVNLVCDAREKDRRLGEEERREA
ncbi:MAG: MotA/TolQ/ExbB proton channel family protein [Verrucomicrobiales bacterium]